MEFNLLKKDLGQVTFMCAGKECNWWEETLDFLGLPDDTTSITVMFCEKLEDLSVAEEKEK